MVLCKFFMQGTCRFGQSCRFEHSVPQNGASNVSPLLRDSVQSTPNVQVTTNVQANQYHSSNKKEAPNIKDVFTIIQKDLIEAENGGMWPLSCYNFWPPRAHGNVPGIDDLSPEELRYLMLQAQAAGNMEAFNQQIQHLYQQARTRFNSLKVASPETLAIIENMLLKPATSSSQFSFAIGGNVAQDSWPSASPSTTGQTSLFGGSSASVFGGTQSSVFGGASAGQQTVFGGTQQPGFGAPNVTQQSGFGAPNVTQQTGFGAPNVTQQTGFGAPNVTQQTGFGAPNVTQQTGFVASNVTQQTVFGGINPTTVPQASVFGGARPGSEQPSPFGVAGSAAPSQAPFFSESAPQTTLFPGATQPQGPAFGSSPAVGQSGGSIFGGSSGVTSQASSFSFALPNRPNSGQIPAASSFGFQVDSNSKSMFGGANAQPSGNMFGGFQPVQVQQAPTSAQVQITPNYSIYTPLAQLTEADRKEFEAGTFTVGRIPIIPPPRELC